MGRKEVLCVPMPQSQLQQIPVPSSLLLPALQSFSCILSYAEWSHLHPCVCIPYFLSIDTPFPTNDTGIPLSPGLIAVSEVNFSSSTVMSASLAPQPVSDFWPPCGHPSIFPYSLFGSNMCFFPLDQAQRIPSGGSAASAIETTSLPPCTESLRPQPKV